MLRTLSKGDIVDVVAPAYTVTDSEVALATNYLKSLNLIPRIPDNFINEDLFFSNSDKVRFSHLKDVLYREDSKAIWCLKGGYGSARLLSELNKLPPPKKEKLVIGFSDITALHLFLNQKWGWTTLHAPLLAQIATGKVAGESIDKLTDVLFGRESTQEFSLQSLNGIENDTKSSLIGGNLTIVQNSIGTFWQMDATDKIILLEEVDEQEYKIDRSLLHLSQAGIFDKAKAVILGDFSGHDITLDAGKVFEVLIRFAAQLDIPVLKIAGVGHKKINNPVPLGTDATLTFGKNISLNVST